MNIKTALEYTTCMDKVYLVLSGNQNFLNTKVLGVFAEKTDAKNRCLREHSFSKNGWILERGWTDRWTNGLGYHVMVVEYEVE